MLWCVEEKFDRRVTLQQFFRAMASLFFAQRKDSCHKALFAEKKSKIQINEGVLYPFQTNFSLFQFLDKMELYLAPRSIFMIQFDPRGSVTIRFFELEEVQIYQYVFVAGADGLIGCPEVEIGLEAEPHGVTEQRITSHCHRLGLLRLKYLKEEPGELLKELIQSHGGE